MDLVCKTCALAKVHGCHPSSGGSATTYHGSKLHQVSILPDPHMMISSRRLDTSLRQVCALSGARENMRQVSSELCGGRVLGESLCIGLVK